METGLERNIYVFLFNSLNTLPRYAEKDKKNPLETSQKNHMVDYVLDSTLFDV